ncbi:MAG: hypothetical protein JO263_06105 [Candidatus Eremiobacteraeota bacterium]|nr:hypothetical protein [Candidatus Eremiobacteraeota bacterium]
MMRLEVSAVKSYALSFISVLALMGQTPSQSTPARHLVYEFGYNTAVASSGQGTGTTTIDIMGPAKDGGVMISGTDFWWNTVRPRATNTCELYPSGKVSCSAAPSAISPIQLTIFPLLASHYFSGLNASGTSSWLRTYTVYAAVLPGAASGFASNAYTWNCTYSLQGKGLIPKAGGAILVQAHGTLAQQGGRYWKASSKQRIAYDPAAGIPVVVRDVRTHLPMRSVYSNDLVELKLKKDSQSK